MKADIRTVIRLLYNFSKNIDKRSAFFFLGSEKVFPKILDWRLIAWKCSWKTRSLKETTDEWAHWFELEHILDTTITKIGENAIQQMQFFSTLFLDHFKKHVENHKSEQIKTEKRIRFYAEDLVRLFYNLVFDKVSLSDERYDFWENFPKEWTITKSNLISKDNLVPQVLFHEFLEKVEQRIHSDLTNDIQLSDSLANLFPELDPETWAVILIFLFSGYDPDNRMKSIIEKKWTIGFSHRPVVFENLTNEEMQAQLMKQKELETQNTYELALFVFPSVLTQRLLRESLEQVNGLKYPADSIEEHKKTRLIEVFNGLLTFLEKS